MIPPKKRSPARLGARAPKSYSELDAQNNISTCRLYQAAFCTFEHQALCQAAQMPSPVIIRVAGGRT